MMVMAAAMERTEKQWRTLMDSVGLKIEKIWTDKPEAESIIEMVLQWSAFIVFVKKHHPTIIFGRGACLLARGIQFPATKSIDYDDDSIYTLIWFSFNMGSCEKNLHDCFKPHFLNNHNPHNTITRFKAPDYSLVLKLSSTKVSVE